MTKIRANCPVCGEVNLLPNDVTLRIVRTADSLIGEQSCYRFVCPDCDELVSKPADDRIAQLLSRGGVAVETVAAEPPPCPPAPPITDDDLLDFHRAIQDDEKLFQACAELVHRHG